MASEPMPTKLRDDGLTIISIWHFLVGIFFLIVTVVVMMMTFVFGIQTFQALELMIPTFLFGTIALIFMVLTLINLAVGYGLWTQRSWARTGALALALAGLIFVPIGTVAGALTLWYLLRPETAALFSPPRT